MDLWKVDPVFETPGWHVDVDVELGCHYVRFGKLVLATVGTLDSAFDLIEALTAKRNPDVEVRAMQEQGSGVAR